MKTICEICKEREVHHEHHKDGDHKNDSPENIQYLCTFCHAKIHNISPKQSELKRLVIMRDRAIRIRNALDNQIYGFSRIEYIVPKEWSKERKKFNDKIKKLERETKKLLKQNYKEITEWLKQIKGINFVTIGKLVSYIDIENTPTISALWRFCGLDATHIKRMIGVTKEEVKKYGNPYLKKELLGILGKLFIIKRTSIYREIYDEEKEKQLNREYPEGFLKKNYNGYKKTDTHLTKGHTHNRAVRKMVKIFLEHFWVQWRTLKNLPITKPYIIGKDGHKNYIKAMSLMKPKTILRAKIGMKPMGVLRTIMKTNERNIGGVDD